MNFTELYGIKVEDGHASLDFIDIDTEKDTKLFLDPSLIESIQEGWGSESSKIISNFFNNIFQCYENNDRDRLFKILSFGTEPNETNLGMSEGKPRGKGNSSEGLVEIFDDIMKRGLLEDDMIKKPMDLCVFVHDFAEDGMSDLVTNILRRKLNEFTVEQCLYHDIELSKEKIEIGYAWNQEVEEWEVVKEYALTKEDKVILLVPKNIVRKSYVYSIGEYLNKKILEHRQDYHVTNNTSLARIRKYVDGREEIIPPTKKQIIEKEIADISYKDYATQYTKENPDLIIEFRNQIMSKTILGKFSLRDEELDEILYK